MNYIGDASRQFDPPVTNESETVIVEALLRSALVAEQLDSKSLTMAKWKCEPKKSPKKTKKSKPEPECKQEPEECKPKPCEPEPCDNKPSCDHDYPPHHGDHVTYNNTPTTNILNVSNVLNNTEISDNSILSNNTTNVLSGNTINVDIGGVLNENQLLNDSLNGNALLNQNSVLNTIVEGGIINGDIASIENNLNEIVDGGVLNGAKIVDADIVKNVDVITKAVDNDLLNETAINTTVKQLVKNVDIVDDVTGINSLKAGGLVGDVLSKNSVQDILQGKASGNLLNSNDILSDVFKGKFVGNVVEGKVLADAFGGDIITNSFVKDALNIANVDIDGVDDVHAAIAAPVKTVANLASENNLIESVDLFNVAEFDIGEFLNHDA